MNNKMARLTEKLEEQFNESAKLESEIRQNLKEMGYGNNMRYSLDEIKGKVRKSLYLLWDNDKYLLSIDANERSITHRLALYLEQEFRDLNVDCEYNREGDDPKRYHEREIVDQINKAGINADDTEDKTAFPDIIVHKRGNNEDNLLVIEVKKYCGNHTEIDGKDKLKLEAFTVENQFRYKYGIALQIPVNGKSTASLWWFTQGKEINGEPDCYDISDGLECRRWHG